MKTLLAFFSKKNEKKHFFISLSFLFLTFLAQAQNNCVNLVPNGDFTLGNNGSFTTGLNPSCVPATCAATAFCVGLNFQNKCGTWPTNITPTAPSGGNFMSVDGFASGAANQVIWRNAVAIPVTAGSTYTFSYWIRAVYPTSSQIFDIDMSIENASGTGLGGQIDIISQSPTIWQKKSVTWACPSSGVSGGVFLTLRQVTPGSFRDFGIDDISFCTPIPCKSSFTLTQVQGPCGEYQVTNTSTGALPMTSQWCDGTTGNTHPNLVIPVCAPYTFCLTTTCADGSTSTSTQTVTPTETVKPIIVCPSSYTTTCNKDVSPAFAGTATATDNCTATQDIIITYTDLLNGTIDCADNIKRTWTATDKCGNTSSCVQLISVKDNIPPVINGCQASQTVSTTTGLCTYQIKPWIITATDNCDPNPTLTFVYTNPSGGTSTTTIPLFLPKGTNTFVYTAKDKCGNISTCTFTILVKDNEKPTITCPLSISVIGNTNNPTGQCKAVVNGLAPIVTDNCPMVSTTYVITGAGATPNSGANDASGANFMSGVSTVTYTATDMGGNTATCSFTVNVKCDTCKCGIFTNMTFRPSQGGLTKFVKCGDTLSVVCNGNFNPIFGGAFECMGINCPAAPINWNLIGLNGSALGGGSTTGLLFNVPVPASYFSAFGLYQLSFTGICNGKPCPPCKFYVKVSNPITITSGLTGHFPLGNATTFADDISPTNIDGVLTNITTTPSTYLFNGISSWVDCTNDTRGVTDNVSVCAWIKTTEQQKGMWIAGQYNQILPKGYVLSIGDVSNGSIGQAEFGGRVNAAVYTKSTAPLTTPKVNDGKWHCIVGTAGNITGVDTWKIYVDGVLANSVVGPTSGGIAVAASSPFRIGANSNGIFPMLFNGAIEEVRVYNRVLNDCEIDYLCSTHSTSAKDLVEKFDLSIFPNPNDGTFYVRLPKETTANMRFRVTDLTGRLLEEKPTETGSDELQILNVMALPQGLYLLQVVSEGKVLATEKFVKQ